MWLFAANYAYFIPSQSKCFCNTQNGANFEDYTKEMLFVTWLLFRPEGEEWELWGGGRNFDILTF